ncbi:MAG: response regulator [Candidatus Peribacteraceae bacterium]|nr:response regulator [Candidatus Peribacteraceae bacterium]
MTQIQKSDTYVEPKQLLIVEDERALAQALSVKFTKQGYSVTTAYDGTGALEKLKEMHFDGVVMDLLMPRKTGFDVLRERTDTQNKETPFFVLSALGSENDVSTVKMLGAQRYFVKSQTSLKEVVDEVSKHYETDKTHS